MKFRDLPRLTQSICRVGLVLCSITQVSVVLAGQPMRFERISLDEGLSQSAVMAILQDSQGFMWFGTENGLNRYDGYEFHIYARDSSDIPGLGNDFIADIAEGPAGNLWIATDGGGLAKWDRGADRFELFRHDPANVQSIASNFIRTVEVVKGYVWIGTLRNGLDRLDPRSGSIVHFRHNPADSSTLSSDEIRTILGSRSGQIWIGTERGLNRLDPRRGSVTRYLHNSKDPASLSSDRIRAIAEDSRGTLWVGTLGGGLNRLHPDTGEITRLRHDPANPKSLGGDQVYAAFADSAGRLWIGTTEGLDMLDVETGEFVHQKNDPADPTSLGDDYVISIYEDASGVLWVGTKSAGLSKWNPRSWAFGHHTPESSNLSHSVVTSFAEQSNGTLWIGTFGGGLNAIDRRSGRVRYYRQDSPKRRALSDDRVMALLLDSTGLLWVGTMSGGVNLLDLRTGTVRVLQHDPADPRSLGADGVMALFEDREGTVFVGTFGGGVARFDRKSRTFRNFTPDSNDPTSISSPRATAFAEGPNGELWVGTDGGGLNLLDRADGSWRHVRHDPGDPRGLSSDTVYALHADPEGTLWIGTRGGLDRLTGDPGDFQNLHFRNLSHTDGLSNNVVYGIHPDDDGNLWLSTNHGLTRYTPQTGEIKVFHRSHGLQAEEFNFGAHYRSQSGELFFGGSNGFNAFYPDRLLSNPHKPRVVLTNLSTFNAPAQTEQPYYMLSRVGLDYRDDVVTFEYAALDYTSPDENRYAYKLEGFDEDWVEAGSLRRVTYTNLDKGNYVFRVRAANSDGVWNEVGLGLPVSVEPAPWETWWAYFGYLFALLVALAFLERAYHRKRQREAEYTRRLEQEVRARTQELAERNKELHQANQKLHEASLTDALTGLPNRRFLFEEMARQRAHQSVTGPVDASRLVFLMVDLDHFKPVNDRYGHLTGDRMLLQVRDALLRVCGDGSMIVRWGGDEFLVIARNLSNDGAADFAERIRAQIAQQIFPLGNGQIARTTCSIGFAAYPFLPQRPDLLSWEQTLGIADVAMFRAKAYRNAWLSISGTDKASAADGNVFENISENFDQLAEDGFLLTHCSLSDAVESRAG